MENHAAPSAQVVLMDGTFASLTEGRGSSIARIHAMLSGEMGALPGQVQLHYAEGQQWAAWRTLPELVSGATLDRNIRLAYGWLAQNWRPGIPLYLFGYSRGGVGVCALADMIARIGLLRGEHASEQNIMCAWNTYRYCGGPRLQQDHCHDEVPIRMIGLLDTVMSLGIRLPFLWTVSEPNFDYAKGRLPANVQDGAHALALDETRSAFRPILWDDGLRDGSVRDDELQHDELRHDELRHDKLGHDNLRHGGSRDQRLQQMWFRGCHSDIGGQLGGYEDCRPLANLPLVWLMAQAETHGLPLPEGWRNHHPLDDAAPSVGSWHSWGKIFLRRAPRQAGGDQSQALHDSVERPYDGPAQLVGHLANAGPPPRARRLRLPRDGGMDSSATA